MPSYQRPNPKWNIDPDAALAEMERRIEDAEAFQNFANCKALEQFPHNIGRIRTDEVHLKYTKISNLSGLHKIPEISKLSLGEKLTDLSEISRLPKLEMLDCELCEHISDLSPISTCTKLINLHLDVGNVADLSPLGKLNKLTYLLLTNYRGQKIPKIPSCQHLIIICTDQVEIDGSQFSSWPELRFLKIAAVKNMGRFSRPFSRIPSLETLLVDNFNMGELGDLGLCKNLTRLEIRGSKLADVHTFLELHELRTLDISRSAVREIAALSTLPRLVVLSANDTPVGNLNGWHKHGKIRTLRLNHTRLDDLSPLADSGLIHLEVEGTNVSKFAPVASCRELSYLDVSSTSIRDLSGIERLRKLAYLSIAFSKVESLEPVLNNPEFLTKNIEPYDFREKGKHGFKFYETPVANSTPKLREISKMSSPQHELLRYFETQ